MKNGFKSKIGNVFCFLSLLLLVSFYGCRTSKNSVIKEKVSIEKSDLKIEKFDSVSKIDKINKIDNSFERQQTDFKQKLDISFNGLSNEDKFELTFTENGFTAKGKGSVNLKTETNKKDSTSNNKVDEIFKEKSDIRKIRLVQNKVDESKTKVDKNKENKSFGPSFNSTIIITIAVVVILILLWKFGLPNFKSK